jgi:hypothetical protein
MIVEKVTWVHLLIGDIAADGVQRTGIMDNES